MLSSHCSYGSELSPEHILIMLRKKINLFIFSRSMWAPYFLVAKVAIFYYDLWTRFGLSEVDY